MSLGREKNLIPTSPHGQARETVVCLRAGGPLSGGHESLLGLRVPQECLGLERAVAALCAGDLSLAVL